MRLTSGTLFKYSQVLLGLEVLEIVYSKIQSSTDNKRNQITAYMKKYYEREFKYSLVKEKYDSKLTTEIIEKMLIKELLTVI